MAVLLAPSCAGDDHRHERYQTHARIRDPQHANAQPDYASQSLTWCVAYAHLALVSHATKALAARRADQSVAHAERQDAFGVYEKRWVLSSDPEFPRFVNSFLQPGLSPSLATPAASRAAKSPPHTPPEAERGSSPVTPSPDLGPVRMHEQMDAPDASTLVLTSLFCYRTRWATQVMCQPFLTLPPPATVPGTQYFPLGPGLHAWCAALDPDAEKESKAEDAPSIPMLLHLLTMQLPSAVPEPLRRRFSHATEVLWDSVTKSSSYNVFLAECGHVVDDALREHSAYTPASIDAAVERVWELQAGPLFGTVAAALRVLTGVFLRLNLVGTEG